MNTKKRLVLAALLCLAISACSGLSLKLATPFKTVSDNNEQDMYLVVVTFTQYSTDGLNEDRFNELTDGILNNIESIEGLYGYSVRRDFLGSTAWTYTIWENKEAMNNFKVSESHRKAMQSAGNVLEQASFARTFIGPDELDYSWEKALALLETDGRTYSFADYASKQSASITHRY